MSKQQDRQFHFELAKNQSVGYVSVADNELIISCIMNQGTIIAENISIDLCSEYKVSCLALNDVLSYCKDPEKILDEIWKICIKNEINLVVSMPNALSIDYVASQYFMSSFLPAQRHMTKNGMVKMLEKHGFEVVEEQSSYSSGNEIEQLRKERPQIAENIDYFTGLYSDNKVEKYYYNCKAVDPKEKKDPKTRPFLTVIIRTVGNRLSALSEAILCLNCQDDMDFEVLIMLHHVDDVNVDKISTIIDSIPPADRERYRLIRVNDGNRATPLNKALEQMKGKYFAVLDDDDLVMGNWVSSFHSNSEEHNGMILHSYAVSQQWSRNLSDILRAEGKFNNFYCNSFDWNIQFNSNRCPFMTLAFPSDIVKETGFRFDETLNMTEDWEFLMKVAAVTGVYDIQNCTAIYRKWSNAENSYTMYSKKEWLETAAEIKNRFKGLKRIADCGEYIVDKEPTQDSETNNTPKMEPELRFGNRIVNSDYAAIKKTRVMIIFEHPYKTTTPGELRIDPFFFGGFQMKNPIIRIVYSDKKVKEYSIHQMRTNGVKNGSSIVFYFTDPQLYVSVEEGAPERVVITFERHEGLPSAEGLRLLPKAYIKLIKQAFSHTWNVIANKS